MRKIYTLINAALFSLSPCLVDSQVVFSEDFSTATGITPPVGWTNNDIAGGGEVWEFNNPGGRTLNAPINDPAAIFDSDNYGGSIAEDCALESPVFDGTVLLGSVILSFDHYFNGGFGGEYFVEVYDGATWNNVLSGTTDTPNPEAQSIDITTLVSGATDAQVRFRWTGDYSWYWILDNVVVEMVSCADPSDLASSNITQTGADVSWTDNAGSGLYNIEWGTPGFTPGTNAEDGSITGTANNPETITGLTQNTTYDIYFQADCGGGDESNWTGPISITTECGIATLPYSTGFDNAFIPGCWEEAGDGTPASGPTNFGFSSWNQDDFLNDANNSSAADINIYTTGKEEWLISPMFDFSAGGPYELEMIVGMTDYNETFLTQSLDADDEIQVLVSNDGGTTWTNVYTWGQSNQPGAAPLTEIIDLSSYNSATTKIAIWATEGVMNNPDDVDFHVDYFEVREIPSCPKPYSLSGIITDTSSFDLTWTPGGNETSWNIEWGAPGFTPGTGTEIGSATSSTPSYTVTGTNQNTTYDVYVQADCGPGDQSVWGMDQVVIPGYGDVCETSIIVDNLPYLTTDNTSNYGDDYSNGPGSMCGTTSNYLNGDDVVYEYTATQDGFINIQLSNLTDTYAGLFIYNSCSDIGMTCADGIVNGSSTADLEITQYPVTTGETYYFVTSTWASPQSTGYDLTICFAEDASFTIPSELCEQSTSVIPNITGLNGGVFSATGGLTIDASTGEVDPSSVSLGFYDITYNTNNGFCSGEMTASVEVVSSEDASFNFSDSSVCSDDNVQTPTVTGVQGGTFSAGAGLDIDASTGAIDPSNSTEGVYTVEYTSSTTACASTEQVTFEVIETEDASFDYGGTEFCLNYEDIVPSISGTSGGTFSAEPGLAINTLTGQIGAEATTPGTYWVYYMTPNNNNCPSMDSVQISVDECLGLNENAMSSISVYPNPANEVVNYVLPEMTGAVNVTMMDATGKVVYENQVNGNAGSQEINVGKFENGMYMITFKNNDQVTTKRIVISR